MIYIGIDPGISGCVAVLDGDGVQFHETPTIEGKAKTKSKVTGKAKVRRLYDEPGMAAILRPYISAATRLAIEQVNAMPKTDPKSGNVMTMGATSMFNFGMGFGIWLGILAALGIPHVRVHPNRWKRVVLADAPRMDSAAVAVAGRLYPAAAAQLRGPRGGLNMGRADALCLAHYATLLDRAATAIEPDADE